MAIDRRSFLKILGAGIVGGGMATLAGGNLLASQKAKAPGPASSKEFLGILVDTTRCVGCRSCEAGCAEANHLPVPDISDSSVFDRRRKTTLEQWTVVNRFETEKGEVFVKTQCMHCNQPGCVSACLVKAFEKKKEGPVTWATNCMGCRYCMIACPFDMPKFEYHSPTPRILKCTLCWERLSKGEKPACVESCPEEALTFGTRRGLVEEAKRRIYGEKEGKYYPHIYGEHEVGGTGYLYLAKVPFDQIGFRTNLGTKAYPEYTKGFFWNIVLVDILIPPFLLGIYHATRREKKVKAIEGGKR
ncbi:MAG: 4Fe-4S dicluster domain-containing protein [Desulfobacterota bacterium]|nr:4Fe-4S dicluster domain-containing protein [Thermodesulfobacteriota bacterium]